ncbi:MAG TPA: protoporphyrinogen oxidase [Gemmatimonadales bacterium]|nr:protoporphyrinogen oxidase [Gemmatimonadales bacterium]
MTRVAVIGAGLAGLAAARQLSRSGCDVTVLDSLPRPGGVVHSTRIAGYLVEDGPNSMAALPPEAAALLGELGLLERRVFAPPEARRRYVVRGGRLTPVPTTPLSLLSASLLTWRARLRLLAEPLAARSRDPNESVAEFARRRIGREAAEYLVDPFIAGVYAGRAEDLSMRHSLPTLWQMEQTHGSLITGALSAARAARRAAPVDRRIWSLPNGLGEIPAAFARELGGRLRTECPVKDVTRSGNEWALTVGGGESLSVNALVWAAPAHQLGLLGSAADPALLQAIAGLPYAPIAVLALGFRRDQVAHPLDGFGFLVPACERRDILGTLFSSTLFPDRAPQGHVLLTTFVGGMRNPAAVDDDIDRQAARVLRELQPLLGVQGEPAFRHLVRWDRAIPQYGSSYDMTLAAIERLEADLPNFRMAGSYRGGVAAGNALASGLAAAARLMDDLSRS